MLFIAYYMLNSNNCIPRYVIMYSSYYSLYPMCIIHPLSQTNISFISCTLFLKMIFRMYYTIIISSWYSFSIINIFLRIISVCNIQYHSPIYISCIFFYLKFLSSKAVCLINLFQIYGQNVLWNFFFELMQFLS